MARKKISIGSARNAFMYDDANHTYGIVVESQIKVGTAPSVSGEVLRFEDLSAGNIGAPGNSGEVLFNNGGLIDADPQFTYNDVANTLEVSNIIKAGQLRVEGGSPDVWLEENGVGDFGLNLTLANKELLFQRRAQSFGALSGTPYRLSIEAPTNTIRINSSGRIGFGGTPHGSSLVDIHGTLEVDDVNLPVSGVAFFGTKLSVFANTTDGIINGAPLIQHGNADRVKAGANGVAVWLAQSEPTGNTTNFPSTYMLIPWVDGNTLNVKARLAGSTYVGLTIGVLS